MACDEARPTGSALSPSRCIGVSPIRCNHLEHPDYGWHDHEQVEQWSVKRLETMGSENETMNHMCDGTALVPTILHQLMQVSPYCCRCLPLKWLIHIVSNEHISI